MKITILKLAIYLMLAVATVIIFFIGFISGFISGISKVLNKYIFTDNS